MRASATRLAVLALSIHLSAHFGFTPLSIVVEARIPPAAENRSACIVVSGWTQSCFQLDGSEAPYVTRREYRSVGEGEYDVYVEVFRAGGGSTRSRPERLVVVGRD